MSELVQTNPRPSTALAKRLSDRRKVVLLDTSGSMGAYLASGEETRIEALRRLASRFVGKYQMYQFNSSHAVFTGSVSELYPTGGTYLADMFKDLRLKGLTQAVLLTDGEAGDPEASLREAIGMKIDCIYIGDGEPPEFLKALSSLAGGKVQTADIADTKEIEATVVGLLEGKNG